MTSDLVYGPRRLGRWHQVCLPRRIARDANIDPPASVEVVPVDAVPGVVLVKPALSGDVGASVRRVSSVGQVVIPAAALEHLGNDVGELYVGVSPNGVGLLLVSPELARGVQVRMPSIVGED